MDSRSATHRAEIDRFNELIAAVRNAHRMFGNRFGKSKFRKIGYTYPAFFQHPDLFIRWSSRFRIAWRYLRKKTAKKGFLMFDIPFFSFSIRI